MRLHLPLLLTGALLTSAAPSASPSPIVKRDGPAVVDAIHKISDQLVKLNSTVTDYDAGLITTLTALHIELESVQLAGDIKDAIRTTQESEPFSQDASVDVSAATLDLEPKIFSTLDTIVRQKDEFDHALLGLFSLSFLVKNNLEQEQELSAKLGKAIAAKLASPYDQVAPQINKQIANAFEEAIAAYS